MSWLRRHRAPLLLGAVVAAPLVVAVVVLATRPWVPVLDMAMTELRVRDVGGRHSPLVGLPGRIGEFPEQGSHPGPWSFYLVAPWYRLAGSSAWGLQFASVVVNAAVGAVIVWLGHRRFGLAGAVVFAALGAVAVRGYGLTVLTHPWNPYFPVLLWVLAVIAAWFCVAGDDWMAVVVVVTSTIAAQTHVPYLVSAVVVNLLALGVLIWRIAIARRAGEVGPLRPLVASVGAGAALWVLPVIEQLIRSPGNITQLLRHFLTDEHEPVIGYGPAGRLVLRHLDAFGAGWDLLARDDAFVHRAGQTSGLALGGIVVLIAWLACAVWAWRRRHRDLMALHAVVAAMLFAGFVSISRIFGVVWFYLTLWMSATMLLVVASIAWTIWIVAASRRTTSTGRRGVVGVSATAIGLASVLSLVAAVDHRSLEERHGDDLHEVLPRLITALEDGVGAASGREGTYIVFWQESVTPGAQGFALLSELERAGFRSGVHPTWRIPATRHRVLYPGDNDAEVHIVSGAWIDEWRTHPERLEVVYHDGRTDEERSRFDELEARVDRRLAEIGRADLVEEVDYNLFGTSLIAGLPADVVADLEEMLQIGEPIALYIAPPGSTF